MIATAPSAIASSIGGVTHQYLWQWENRSVTAIYETLGQGAPVLLLPSLSTVSSRAEMRGLAEKLATKFQVFALDWIGFGQSDRPLLNYQAPLYQQFLQDFVKDTFSEPIAIVAAGHASGYAMQLVQHQPVSRVVLVAPTWRGPLPTMGASSQVAGLVRELVRSPLLGQALYQANTTSSFLRLMYGRHVYVDQNRLTPEFIAQKREITQQPGARFAPAAFVTGALDPVGDRAAFLSLFQPLSIPVLAIIAEQAPPKSRQEMDALATIPGVETRVLPGTLGMHEEYAIEVADAVLPFLA
jgi:pimeloyl-ACP methyl ester carboxylesterase